MASEYVTKEAGYYKNKLKEFREQHKKLGLCIDCNKKAQAGFVRCSEHLEYHRNQQKKARGNE